MRYTLFNVEHKDYQGRKYVKALARDVTGIELEVSLGDKWGDRLSTFKSTDVVEANPWENPKNGKWSLYPIEDKKPSTEPRRASQTPSRDISKDVEAAQKRTTESVNKTLDRKDESIRLSSAQRDAVLITIAMGVEGFTQTDTENQIIKWRNWFLSEDFTDVPPF